MGDGVMPGWLSFSAFLIDQVNFTAEGAEGHVDWIRGRPFESPDEWMGEAGERCRRIWRMKPATEAAAGWERYKTEQAELLKLLDGVERRLASWQRDHDAARASIRAEIIETLARTLPT